jgi:hypothetical protein
MYVQDDRLNEARTNASLALSQIDEVIRSGTPPAKARFLVTFDDPRIEGEAPLRHMTQMLFSSIREQLPERLRALSPRIEDDFKAGGAQATSPLRYHDKIDMRHDGGPRVGGERLTFDDETHTVILDGVEHYGIDPTAFHCFKVIADAKGHPIKREEIAKKVKGINGRSSLSRLLLC